MPKTEAQKAADRAAYDKAYRITPKDFSLLLRDVVDTVNAINHLAAKLGSLKSGAYLVFKTEAGEFKLSRRMLSSSVSAFGKFVMSLKNFFRVSMKKPKQPRSAGSYAGIFAPVYLGSAMTSFLNNGAAGFGPAAGTPGRAGSLMAQLPLAKQGFVLRNSITLLMFIYAHQQNLLTVDNGSIAQADAVMDAAFGGVPCDFVTVPDKSQKVYARNKKTGEMQEVMKKTLVRDLARPGQFTYADRQQYKVKKYPRAEAERLFRFPSGGSCYDSVRVQYEEFTSQIFLTYMWLAIASASTYSGSDLKSTRGMEGVMADLEAKKAGMLQEHNLIKAARDAWRATQPARPKKASAKKATLTKAEKAAQKASAKAMALQKRAAVGAL